MVFLRTRRFQIGDARGRALGFVQPQAEFLKRTCSVYPTVNRPVHVIPREWSCTVPSGSHRLPAFVVETCAG